MFKCAWERVKHKVCFTKHGSDLTFFIFLQIFVATLFQMCHIMLKPRGIWNFAEGNGIALGCRNFLKGV